MNDSLYCVNDLLIILTKSGAVSISWSHIGNEKC